MRTSRGAAGAFIAVAGMWAAPAQAWEYARWGMTPDEVIRASAGAARLLAKPMPRLDGKLLAKVETQTRFDSVSVDAEFRFDPASDRLVAVSLSTESTPSCAAMIDRLRARLGEPATTARIGHASTYAWTDSARSAKVTFIAMEFSAGFRCTAVFTDAARPD